VRGDGNQGKNPSKRQRIRGSEGEKEKKSRGGKDLRGSVGGFKDALETPKKTEFPPNGPRGGKLIKRDKWERERGRKKQGGNKHTSI